MTITELYLLFLRHPVITTDSRNCPSGSLFFALKGEKFDGNRFAEQALRSGCVYAIIDDASQLTDERMILVDNVLSVLQQLATVHRKSFKIPVIGITGTNGKTTTKELTTAVLSQKYKVLSTQGNLNNHIGVPLTLLRLTKEHEIAVIEMGANHLGEIGELVSIACPDYGLITNVGYAHLEGFGSLEGVIKTKGALYEYLRKTNGTVFIHRENNYLMAIAEGMNQITYGGEREKGRKDEEVKGRKDKEAKGRKDEGAKGQGGSHKAFIEGCVTGHHPFLSFKWHHADVSSESSPEWQHKQEVSSQLSRAIDWRYDMEAVYTVNTKLVGGYNLWNVLAATAIGVFFGVPPENINEAITNYEPTNNRSQLKKTAFNELIIDAYNANPSSMKVAIDNFAAIPCSPKAVILGDMLELGEISAELHATVLKQVESSNFEKVLLCGKQFSNVGQQHLCFPTVEQLNKYLQMNPLQGYHILIKGSRSVCLEKVLEQL